jgi:tetratricopeptide (TPR) repeat protein/CheY-like chemotaxis protein
MPKNVLAIVGNPEVGEFFSDFLEQRGDSVTWLTDPKAAEEIFAKKSFDLVLIDVILRQGSGYELCKSLKKTEAGKQTSVLLIGNLLQSFPLAHKMKTQYGADDIIRPNDPEDLAAKLSEYLTMDEPEPESPPSKSPQPVATPKIKPPDFSKNPVAIPFSGSLGQIPFPRVLAYFSLLGQNGTLKLEDGQISKNILLIDGKPASVSGYVRSETLGQLLLEIGKIDAQTLTRAIPMALKTGRRLGEVLLEMKAITPHDLFEAIQHQSREKILDVFTWELGSYSFSLKAPIDRPELSLELDPVELVLSGIRRSWSKKDLESELSISTGLTIYPVKEGVSRVGSTALPTSVQRLLSQVDGRKTLKALLLAQSSEQAETMAAVLALIMLEAIVLAPATKEASEEGPIYKKLGARLLIDESEEGLAYAARIRDDFAAIQSRRSIAVFDLPPESHDAHTVKNRFIELTAGLLNQELYDRADELTRVRVDELLRRYKEAFEELTDPNRLGVRKQVTERPEIASEPVFQEGLVAYERGDYKEAQKHFERAIDLQPETAEYYAYMGSAFYLGGNTSDSAGEQKAMAFLKKAISLNPRYDLAYLFLGRVYRDRGNSDRAEELFEKAYDYNRKSSESLKELRRMFLARKMQKQSESQRRPAAVMELEQKVRGMFNRMAKLNFFELFGADEKTSHDDLRRSYFDLTAQYRPNELFDQLSELIQERSEEIFSRLTEAYSTLINRDSRKEYIETLRLGRDGGDDPSLPPASYEQVQKAQGLAEKGVESMAAKEFKNASLYFRRAVEADPVNASYKAHMALAIYRAFKGSAESHQAALVKAKDLVRQALASMPDCATCHVVLGRIHFEEGKRLLAEEQVELALRAEPDNAEALKLFRLFYTRYGKKKKAKYMQVDPAQFVTVERQIKAIADRMKSQNHFEVLGIVPTATDQELRRAYETRVESYSPEQFFDEVPDSLRYQLNEVVDLLSEAFKVLSDPIVRKEYVRTIGGVETVAAPPDAKAASAPATGPKEPSGSDVKPPSFSSPTLPEPKAGKQSLFSRFTGRLKKK